MEAKILRTDSPSLRKEAVRAAVELLRAGEVVGLPTETVYGLGADVSNDAAVAKVFGVKGRPSFDPLIAHLPTVDHVEGYLSLADTPAKLLGQELVKRFWPGPLTILLPRKSEISFLATAGLPTVALRASAHPIFAEIAGEFGRPIAAPSANQFGRTSPTTAAHVASELGGRIRLIVDGGPTTHGVESTIVALKGGKLQILRHGPITAERLSEFAPIVHTERTAIPHAPGQLASHYAPKTPLQLVDSLAAYSGRTGVEVGALAWHRGDLSGFAKILCLSGTADLREAAANLFSHMRELDEAHLDLIVAEAVPEIGLGRAIMDRLRRAATPVR